jgi:hypothetical protein
VEEMREGDWVKVGLARGIDVPPSPLGTHLLVAEDCQALARARLPLLAVV